MWVCLCQGVTDRQIRAAVDRGARTTCEVGQECRAGTKCGGCLPEMQRLIRDHLFDCSSSHLASLACFECPERESLEVSRSVSRRMEVPVPA